MSSRLANEVVASLPALADAPSASLNRPPKTVVAPRVDMYSDTHTLPTEAMRAAMADAAVGDEQMGEDPSVNRLVEVACELLGKEDAVFLPSGTMCNEIAYAVHCRRGDQIILDVTAHAIRAESGAPAALAGAMVHTLDGRSGVFTADQVVAAIRPKRRQSPRSALLSVEQTSNFGGGKCWSMDGLQSVTNAARGEGVKTHLDGARLLNAVVAMDVPAHRQAEPFDSVWFDLSKGLGAPFGGVLAGSTEFIDEAWRLKQQWGGAMRQAGIMAAGGLYALQHHVSRLADDHDNAQHLAALLQGEDTIRMEGAVETNIVLFSVRDDRSAQDFADQLMAEHGIRICVMGAGVLRAVTHLGVSRADVELAADAIRQMASR